MTLARAARSIDGGLLIAAALALLAIQALLKPGLPTTADLVIHMYRTLEFERAWAPGVLFPRWAPNLAYGYGYPLFIFAPPLPYLFGMLLQAPGLTIEMVFKVLLALTVVAYTTGMYLLVRDLCHSPEAGLVAAVAFGFAPFALREALLYGGNVPQLLAIGLFPWTLWAATRAVQTGRWDWTVVTGLFYAGVMLSHLFQVLIFSPVLGLYLLLLTRPGQLLRAWSWSQLWRTVQPLLAGPIGLLLSAFFWLPVLAERSLTRAEAEVYLTKSPFFVRYPHWLELTAWIQPLDERAANPYVPLTLGLVTLTLAGLGLVGALLGWRKNARLSLLLLFFGAVATGSIFMTLPLSQPVWAALEPLQVAEFPWRMLGLANLGLAVLAGAAVKLVPDRWRRLAIGPIILSQLWAVGPYLYPTVPFTAYGQLTIADQINYERSSQSIGTTTLGEYLPRTVTRTPTTSPLVEAFQANTWPERLDRSTLPAGATASLLEQNAVSHRYRLETPAPFSLRFHHFAYPGWQANLDGQPLPITPEAESGLMRLDIPAGVHDLSIHFSDTPLRLAALSLSALTLLVLPFLPYFTTRSSNNEQLAMSNEQPSTPSTLLRASPPTLQPSNPPTLQPPTLPPFHPSILPLLPSLIIAAVITLVALGVKPLLRPLFTLHSPADRVLPAQHATDIRFENGMRLTGYDLSERVAQPGGYLQVVLYWETDGAPHRTNLQPFVHLDRLDDFTTIADATNYTPGDVTTEMNLPTFHWDNSRYIRDEHDLYLAAETPPLAYAVRAGLIDPDQAGRLVPLADGSGDTAWLDTINVQATSSPRLAESVKAGFRGDNGDVLLAAGFGLETVRPDQLTFNLSWSSPARPQADYTVFAQLLDAEGQLVTGFDRPPLDGAYPTATWLPGQTILDPRRIPLNGVSPGRYRLVVGLYRTDTGQPLRTQEGAGFVELSGVEVP